MSATSFWISTPIISFKLVFADNKILIIPVPVPKSKTFEPDFISFAKSDKRTLSTPKQNPFLFCIIFNPLYSKSSILSFSFSKILIPLF